MAVNDDPSLANVNKAPVILVVHHGASVGTQHELCCYLLRCEIPCIIIQKESE